MSKYNKKMSSFVIIICLLSIGVSLFVQKKDQTNTYDSESVLMPTMMGVGTPFKGEKISVIKLEGVISDSEGNSLFKNSTSSSAVLDLINKAYKDNSVKAVVIRINSPGGTVSASQEIYKAILKTRKRKPVVATMGDIAASGGYYIASATNVIFANPGTLTGSIGVITSYLNFYDLLNKVGIKGITIKAGEFKDIGNPTRTLTEPEKKILQALVDDTYNQFITDVSIGRHVPIEKIAKIAKGLIYTGRQAQKIGLVDHLGDYQLALKHAQTLAKKRFPELSKKYANKEMPIEETWKSTSLIESLLAASNSNISLNSKSLDEKVFKSYSYSKFQPLWLLE